MRGSLSRGPAGAPPTGDTADAATEGDDDGADRPVHGRRVERRFGCLDCGHPVIQESSLSEPRARAVRPNCGEWTAAIAAADDLLAAGREAAGAFAGDTLAERRALADVLRELLGFDRGDAARTVGVSPSGLDDLLDRGRETVADPRRTLAAIDGLRGDDE